MSVVRIFDWKYTSRVLRVRAVGGLFRPDDEMKTSTQTWSAEGSAGQVATAFVLVAMVGMAFKGIFAKLAYAEGVSVAGVLAGRVWLATPMFWVVAWAMGRLEGWSIDRATWRAFGMGLVFLVAAGADFVAVERLGAGPSRVLLFSYPGLVLALQAWRRRAWPPRHHVGVFVVAWAGLMLVSTPGGLAAMSPEAWFGVGCSAVAAASYAWFTVESQPLVERLGSVRFVVASNTGAALALTVAAPWVGLEASGVGAPGFGWLVAMAWLATVGPVFLTFEGIGRIGAERVGLLMLLGPVVTLAAAWAVLGEVLTGTQLVGTALVLGAMGGLKVFGGPGRSRPGRVDSPRS
jgi:drug/metabolite transporter (DMT)-like permease